VQNFRSIPKLVIVAFYTALSVGENFGEENKKRIILYGYPLISLLLLMLCITTPAKRSV